MQEMVQQAGIATGNPFTPGPYVPPERFVGRELDLRAVLARLSQMGSVSLVGDARIGKTSLLRYLEANLPVLLSQYGRFLPIYISMDAQPSTEAFCQQILERLLPQMPVLPQQEQMLRAMERRLQDGPAPTLRETSRLLEQAAQGGLRIVLLLDEFKDMLERPEHFDDAFRGVLRSLYTSRQTALVLSTRQPLTKIAGLNPYFANAIVVQQLGLFSDSASEALLRQPHNRPFTNAEVRLGCEVGRNHPLRLQAAGWWLYEWKGEIPGPIHDGQGQLREGVFNLLNREVEREYEEAKRASRPEPTVTQPRRLFVGIGRAALRTGETYDRLQAHVAGVFIFVAVGVACVLLVAFGLRLITWEQITNLVQSLIRGSR
ncbi:MAG TPA: ATP-binding protein [Herpetosiphonaceae bacterium]|nr:ATP-binding protein [Herpetosiphonaceae bacterium]